MLAVSKLEVSKFRGRPLPFAKTSSLTYDRLYVIRVTGNLLSKLQLHGANHVLPPEASEEQLLIRRF
jgi:hypothetical protein